MMANCHKNVLKSKNVTLPLTDHCIKMCHFMKLRLSFPFYVFIILTTLVLLIPRTTCQLSGPPYSPYSSFPAPAALYSSATPTSHSSPLSSHSSPSSSSPSSSNFSPSNIPPRFTSYISPGSNESNTSNLGSEIVVIVREGPSSLGKELLRVSGEDPDGDEITFGVLGTLGLYILRVENVPKSNSAIIYLNQELDRETRDTYNVLLTLTDGKLGKGNYVTKTMVIIVEDANDNDPIFKPFNSVISLLENSRPGIIETVEATDIDQGRFGQVLYSIQELDNAPRDPATFSIETMNGKGIIRLIGQLDFEKKSNYKLEIVAYDRGTDDNQRSSSAMMTINVQDVNDNSPMFVKKLFTGGLTTNADFGSVFMTIKAIDLDSGLNAEVKYYITSPIQRKMSIGLDNVRSDPFLLNKKTGEISLNFDPQKDMKGYFEFDVMANDTDGFYDTAKVNIYLLREDQRVRFVLRLAPAELREKLEKFLDVLANITGAIVNVDNYKYHETFDGNVDKRRTDLYLHFVSTKDNSIMEVNSVLTLIDKNQQYLVELYKEFNVLLSEPAVYQEELKTWEDQLKSCLIGSTAFLALLLMVVTCLCLSQRVSYERQLKAARTTTITSLRDPRLNRGNVPNTNIHADEGSNPIWMTGYDNEWYDKDDEQISDTSTGNSLDENVIGTEIATESTNSPSDSLNGSARGSNSLKNDRSALYNSKSGNNGHLVSGGGGQFGTTSIVNGRLTPSKISLPSKVVSSVHPQQYNSNPSTHPHSPQSVNQSSINNKTNYSGHLRRSSGRNNNQKNNHHHHNNTSQMITSNNGVNQGMTGGGGSGVVVSGHPSGAAVTGGKPAAPRPPISMPRPLHQSSQADGGGGHEVTCKSSVNTVYISSYGQPSNPINNSSTGNQLSNNNLISLETTEL